MTMNNSMHVSAVLGDAARAAARVDSFTARGNSKLHRLANKRTGLELYHQRIDCASKRK